MSRGKPGTATNPKPSRVGPFIPKSLRGQDKPLDTGIFNPGGGNALTLENISEAIAIQDAIDTLKSLDLAELYAKRFTKEAVDTMVELMRDDQLKPDVRLKAAMAIISRGWGSPAIAIRASSDAMDKDKRKNIEKEVMEAQRAANILMERAAKGFAIPMEGFGQEGDGASFIDADSE